MTRRNARRGPVRVRIPAAVALVASSLLATLAVGMGVSGASVEDSTPERQIRQVDARDGKVTIDYVYRGDQGGAAKVVMNGKEVAATTSSLAEAGVRSSVVVVLDHSAALSNGTVQLAKEGLENLAPGTGAISELGLVGAGNEARVLAQPATTIEAVTANLDGVIPNGATALWDATVIAGELAAESSAAQRNVVLVVGSADAGSAASFTEALNALRDADASVHVIAMAGSTADGESLRELVGRLGGSFQVGTDDDFAELYGGVTELIGDQFRATLTDVAATEGEFANVTLSVGGVEVQSSFRPGVLSVGTEQTRAIGAFASPDGGFFAQPIIKYTVVALFALGAAGAFFAVANLMGKRNDGLGHVLRHYDERYGDVSSSEEEGVGPAVLQRAVEITGNLAQERGLLVRVENLLERADLPLRAAEALTFYLGGALASVALALVATKSFVVAGAVVLFALLAPGFVVDFLAKRRKKKFNQYLPDMLALLAGTLRAGFSIGQGFEAVSGEIDDPMGKELRRAVTEARLGRPLDEALEAIAFRMDSDDFAWAVMAIRIQKEVGGNLAELLMTVSDTMTQRERLRRDVASLTAEGRMSAIILGLLPPGLGLAMYFMNPEYISKLFSGTGLVLLVASFIMMLVGFVWMKKTITIEV